MSHHPSTPAATTTTTTSSSSTHAVPVSRLDSGRQGSAGGSSSWAASSRSNSRYHMGDNNNSNSNNNNNNNNNNGGGPSVSRSREQSAGGRQSPEQAAAATAAAVVASLCSSLSPVSSPNSHGGGGAFALSSGDSRPASRHTAKQKQQQRHIRQVRRQQQQQQKQEQEQINPIGSPIQSQQQQQRGRLWKSSVHSVKKRRVSAGAVAAASVKKKQMRQLLRKAGGDSGAGSAGDDEVSGVEDDDEDAGKNHATIYGPAAAAANAAAHYQSFQFSIDEDGLQKKTKSKPPQPDAQEEGRHHSPMANNINNAFLYPVPHSPPLPITATIGGADDTGSYQPHSSGSEAGGGPAGSLLSLSHGGPAGQEQQQQQQQQQHTEIFGGSRHVLNVHPAHWGGEQGLENDSNNIPATTLPPNSRSHHHSHSHSHHPQRLAPSSTFVNENISFFDKSSFTPPQSQSGGGTGTGTTPSLSHPSTAAGGFIPPGTGTVRSHSSSGGGGATPVGSSRGRSPPTGRPTSLRLGPNAHQHYPPTPTPHTNASAPETSAGGAMMGGFQMASPPPPPPPLLAGVAPTAGRPGTADSISAELGVEQGCGYSGLWTQRAATSHGAGPRIHTHYPRPLSLGATASGGNGGGSGSFLINSPNDTTGHSPSLHMESSGPDEPSVFTQSYRAIMHSLHSTTIGEETELPFSQLTPHHQQQQQQHRSSQPLPPEEHQRSAVNAPSPSSSSATAKTTTRPYIYRPNDKKRELDVYRYYQGQQELADLVVAQEEAGGTGDSIPANHSEPARVNSSSHHNNNSGTIMSTNTGGQRASTSPAGTISGLSSQNPLRSTVRGSQIFSDVCSRSGSVFGFAPELGATAILALPPNPQASGPSMSTNQFNSTSGVLGAQGSGSHESVVAAQPDFYSDKALHGGNAYAAGVNSPFYPPPGSSSHMMAVAAAAAHGSGGGGRENSVDFGGASGTRPHTSPFTLVGAGQESIEASTIMGGANGPLGGGAEDGTTQVLTSGENSTSRHRMSSAGASRRGRPWRAGPPGTVPVKTMAGSVTRMHPGQAGKAIVANNNNSNNNNSSLPSPPQQQSFADGSSGPHTKTSSSAVLDHQSGGDHKTSNALLHGRPSTSGSPFLVHASADNNNAAFAGQNNSSNTILHAGPGGISHRRVTLKDPEVTEGEAKRRVERHRAFQLRHQIRSFERRYRRRRGILETKKVDELLRAVAEEHFARRERVYREKVGDPNLEDVEAVNDPLQQGRHILNGALGVQRRELRSKKRQTAISTGAWRRYRQTDSSSDDDDEEDDLTDQSWLWEEEEEEEEGAQQEELNPFTRAAQREREERMGLAGRLGGAAATRSGGGASSSSCGTKCPTSTSTTSQSQSQSQSPKSDRFPSASPAHLSPPPSGGGPAASKGRSSPLINVEESAEVVSSCGSDEPERDFWGVIPGGRRKRNVVPGTTTTTTSSCTSATGVKPPSSSSYTIAAVGAQPQGTPPLPAALSSSSSGAAGTNTAVPSPLVGSPLTVGSDPYIMTRGGIVSDRFGGAVNLSAEPSAGTYTPSGTTIGHLAHMTPVGTRPGGTIDFGLDNTACWGEDVLRMTSPEALMQTELTKAVNKIQMAHFAMGKNKGDTLHELQRRHSMASAVHRARIGSCSASAMVSKAGTWPSRSGTEMPDLPEGKVSLSGAMRSASMMPPSQLPPTTTTTTTTTTNALSSSPPHEAVGKTKRRPVSSRAKTRAATGGSSKSTTTTRSKSEKKKVNGSRAAAEGPEDVEKEKTAGLKSPLVHVIPTLPTRKRKDGGGGGGVDDDGGSDSSGSLMEQLELSTNSPTPAYRSTLGEPQTTAPPISTPPPAPLLDAYGSVTTSPAAAAAAAAEAAPSLSTRTKRKSPDPTVTAYNVPLPKRLGRCLMQHKPLHRCVHAAARLISFVLMRSLPRALYEGNPEDFALLMREEEAMLMEAIQGELAESLAAARAAAKEGTTSAGNSASCSSGGAGSPLMNLQRHYSEGSEDTRGRFEHLLGVLNSRAVESSTSEEASPERGRNGRGGGVQVLGDDPSDEDEDESGRRTGHRRTYPPSRGESASPGGSDECNENGESKVEGDGDGLSVGSPSQPSRTVGAGGHPVDCLAFDFDEETEGHGAEEANNTHLDRPPRSDGLPTSRPPRPPLAAQLPLSAGGMTASSEPYQQQQQQQQQRGGQGGGLISLYSLPAPPPLGSRNLFQPMVDQDENSDIGHLVEEQSTRSIRQFHVLRVERSRDLDAPSTTSRMSGAPAFSKEFMGNSRTSTVLDSAMGEAIGYMNSSSNASVQQTPSMAILQQRLGSAGGRDGGAVRIGGGSEGEEAEEVRTDSSFYRPATHPMMAGSGSGGSGTTTTTTTTTIDVQKSTSYSGSYPTGTQTSALPSPARSGQSNGGVAPAEEESPRRVTPPPDKNAYTLEEVAGMLPPSTELRPPPHGERRNSYHRLSKGDKRFGVLRHNSSGGSAGGSDDEDSRTALFSSTHSSPTKKDRASAAWGTVGAVRRPFSKGIPDRVTPSPKKRQAVRLHHQHHHGGGAPSSSSSAATNPSQHDKVGIYGGAGGAALAALLSRSTSTMCKIIVALYKSAVHEANSLEGSLVRGGSCRKLSNSCGSLRSPSAHLRRTSSSLVPMQQRLFPPFPPDLLSMLKQYARRTPRSSRDPEELLTNEDREKVRNYITECLFGGLHGFSPMAVAAARGGGFSAAEAVPSLPPMLAMLLAMIEQKDVVLTDGAERPLTISPLLVMSHGGYGLAPFSGEPYKFLMRYRDQVDKVSRMLQQSVDGPSPTRKVAFRPLLIEKLIKPGQSLLPLSSLMMALRHCVRHNSALRYEEARCFVGSIELRLMVDLMESFAELSDSFSHRHESVLAERELKRQKDEVAAAVAVAVENAMGSTAGAAGGAAEGDAGEAGEDDEISGSGRPPKEKDGKGGSASRLGVLGAAAGVNGTGSGEEFSDLFFEIYHETLLDWSCVVICEAAIGYAMDLGGPGLAHFKLASYESTAILSDDQVDEILSSDILDHTLPNIPFSRHNPQVAYSVVEKNRSVVLEALVRLKGELYFLLTGLDHRQNLLETHHRLLQVVKAGSLRRQQNRTVQRKVLPVDGATIHRTLGEELACAGAAAAAAAAAAGHNHGIHTANGTTDFHHHHHHQAPPQGTAATIARSNTAGGPQAHNTCIAAAGRVGAAGAASPHHNSNPHHHNNRVQLIDIPLNQNVGFAFSLTSPHPQTAARKLGNDMTSIVSGAGNSVLMAATGTTTLNKPMASAGSAGGTANSSTAGKRAGTAPSGGAGGGLGSSKVMSSPVNQHAGGGRAWPGTATASVGAPPPSSSSAAGPSQAGYPESFRSVSRAGGGGGGHNKANSVSHGSIYHMHTSKMGGNCTVGIHHTTIEAMETAIEEVTAGMQCTPLQLVLFSLPMRGNVCTKKNVPPSGSDEDGDEESVSMAATAGRITATTTNSAVNMNPSPNMNNNNNNNNNDPTAIGLHSNNNTTTTATSITGGSPKRNPISCTVAGEDSVVHSTVPWSPIQGGRLGGASSVGPGGSICSPGLLAHHHTASSGSSWTSAPIRLLVPEGATQVLQFDDDGTPLPGTGFNVSFTTKPVVAAATSSAPSGSHPQQQPQSRTSQSASGRAMTEGSVHHSKNPTSSSESNTTTTTNVPSTQATIIPTATSPRPSPAREPPGSAGPKKRVLNRSASPSAGGGFRHGGSSRGVSPGSPCGGGGGGGSGRLGGLGLTGNHQGPNSVFSASRVGTGAGSAAFGGGQPPFFFGSHFLHRSTQDQIMATLVRHLQAMEDNRAAQNRTNVLLTGEFYEEGCPWSATNEAVGRRAADEAALTQAKVNQSLERMQHGGRGGASHHHHHSHSHSHGGGGGHHAGFAAGGSHPPVGGSGAGATGAHRIGGANGQGYAGGTALPSTSSSVAGGRTGSVGRSLTSSVRELPLGVSVTSTVGPGEQSTTTPPPPVIQEYFASKPHLVMNSSTGQPNATAQQLLKASQEKQIGFKSFKEEVDNEDVWDFKRTVEIPLTDPPGTITPAMQRRRAKLPEAGKLVPPALLDRLSVTAEDILMKDPHQSAADTSGAKGGSQKKNGSVGVSSYVPPKPDEASSVADGGGIFRSENEKRKRIQQRFQANLAASEATHNTSSNKKQHTQSSSSGPSASAGGGGVEDDIVEVYIQGDLDLRSNATERARQWMATSSGTNLASSSTVLQPNHTNTTPVRQRPNTSPSAPKAPPHPSTSKTAGTTAGKQPQPPPRKAGSAGGTSTAAKKQQPWYTHGDGSFNHQRLVSKLKRSRPKDHFDLNAVSPLIALKSCVETRDLDPLPVESDTLGGNGSTTSAVNTPRHSSAGMVLSSATHGGSRPDSCTTAASAAAYSTSRAPSASSMRRVSFQESPSGCPSGSFTVAPGGGASGTSRALSPNSSSARATPAPVFDIELIKNTNPFIASSPTFQSEIRRSTEALVRAQQAALDQEERPGGKRHKPLILPPTTRNVVTSANTKLSLRQRGLRFRKEMLPWSKGSQNQPLKGDMYHL